MLVYHFINIFYFLKYYLISFIFSFFILIYFIDFLFLYFFPYELYYFKLLDIFILKSMLCFKVSFMVHIPLLCFYMLIFFKPGFYIKEYKKLKNNIFYFNCLFFIVSICLSFVLYIFIKQGFVNSLINYNAIYMVNLYNNLFLMSFLLSLVILNMKILKINEYKKSLLAFAYLLGLIFFNDMFFYFFSVLLLIIALELIIFSRFALNSYIYCKLQGFVT